MQDQEILQEAINRYGVDAQSDMMIEECSELIQALLKLRRNYVSSDFKYQANVMEEMADVEIMLDQMKLIFNPKAVLQLRQQKINRLKERLGL